VAILAKYLVLLVPKVGHLLGLGAPRVPQHHVWERPLLDVDFLTAARILHLHPTLHLRMRDLPLYATAPSDGDLSPWSSILSAQDWSRAVKHSRVKDYGYGGLANQQKSHCVFAQQHELEKPLVP